MYRNKLELNYLFNCHFFISWTWCHGNISIVGYINHFVNGIHPKSEGKFIKSPLKKIIL